MEKLKELYEDNKEMAKPVLIMLFIGLIIFFGGDANV